jgi:Ca2+-binding RTX toxin-like protein
MSSFALPFRGRNRSQRRTTNRAARGSQSSRLLSSLERLEDRSLLSVLIVAGGTATFTASNGIRNNLNITLDGTNYLIIDSSDNITVAGSGSAACTGSGTNIVTCPGASIDRFDISLGDLDDNLKVNSTEADAQVTANGGAGNDVMVGAPVAANLLRGDAGNDNLTGGAGADTLVGGDGDDVMNGGAGIDLADYSSSPVAVRISLSTGKAKGPGKDLVSAIDNVLGSNFNDNITGNDEINVLDGGAGNDKINGAGGNDVLTGGLGNDAIAGGLGNDNLDGGEGNDRLNGDAGNDILTGGNGNDVLNGGNDNDQHFGGAGNDSLNGGLGVDELRGEAGIDQIIRDPSDTVIDLGPQP